MSTNFELFEFVIDGMGSVLERDDTEVALRAIADVLTWHGDDPDDFGAFLAVLRRPVTNPSWPEHLRVEYEAWARDLADDLEEGLTPFDPRLQPSDIPDDFVVRPLTDDEHPPGESLCGTCGLSWDDDIVTGITPVPSARCPFEQFHKERP